MLVEGSALQREWNIETSKKTWGAGHFAGNYFTSGYDLLTDLWCKFCFESIQILEISRSDNIL